MISSTIETVEQCDEQLAFWTKMSSDLGLPVLNDDGTDAIDSLLELRNQLNQLHEKESKQKQGGGPFDRDHDV